MLHFVLLFAAAFVAGGVNSVAGGGTLLTYPSLLAAGISPITANATSTVALVPGSLGAFWGYRQEVSRDRRLLIALLAPNLVGGAIGAWLVLVVSEQTFAHLVPWLILGATVLFVLQDTLNRWLGHDGDREITGGRLAAILGIQLVTATYGGFFGAGMGIVMLAALGLAGMRDLHRMNGLKNYAAASINGIAAVTFLVGRRVNVPVALTMAVGAVAGGYLAAGVARRLGRQAVRYAVISVGFGVSLVIFWKLYH